MTPPSQDILTNLVDMTTDGREKRLLATLAQDSNMYDRWRVKKAVTLPQLLETFPHLSLDPLMLLRRLPTLQPRAYAIASAPVEEKIRVATAIVKEKGERTRIQFKEKSICSTFES